MNSREILARNLKALMTARDLSTHRIGVPQSSVKRILSGKGCTLASLDDLATSLDVTPGDLIGMNLRTLPRDDRAARLMARLTKQQRAEIYRSMARIAWSNRAVIREGRQGRKGKRK